MSVKTARELLSDPTFLGLCECWKEGGRCPVPLIDLLLEYGLEEAADRARWAVEYKERKMCYANGRWVGPTPRSLLGRGNSWVWEVFTTESTFDDADDLPFQDHNTPLGAGRYTTFPEAIAVFLDNFRVPAPAVV